MYFSAILVGLFQGIVTLFAEIIEPVITVQALSNISLTGSIMIFYSWCKSGLEEKY